MPKSTIELKGSVFTLPVIHLHECNLEAITEELIQKVKLAPSMLKNASVVVNVSALNDDLNLSAIRDAILEAGINIVGVSGHNEKKRQAAMKAGLSVLSEGKSTSNTQTASAPQPAPVPVPEKTLVSVDASAILPPLLINTPVRSGQQIYAKNRDLIVTAAVSHGAEIIADGNIHVYSRMKGKAIAGANNNPLANIFCTQLEAELISIAGNYWLADQIPAQYFGKAVRIQLSENTLNINSLHID